MATTPAGSRHEKYKRLAAAMRHAQIAGRQTDWDGLIGAGLDSGLTVKEVTALTDWAIGETA